MNEHEWIIGAKRGDSVSLTALIESNYQVVYRYVYKLTFDKHLSEDITQDTFTKLIIHLERFEPQAKLSTYLITIASNLLKDHYKKNHTRNKLLEYIKEQKKSMADAKGDTQLILKEVLLKLDVDSRTIVVLNEYYGYKLEEISEILKMPVGTIKSKRHYALKKLREEGLYE